MELISFKKIFALHIILFFSVFFAKAVWAESFNTPKIKYIGTVDEFEGQKIQSFASINLDTSDELYLLDSSKRTVYILNNSFQPTARVSKEQGLVSPSLIATNKDGEIYVVEVPIKGNTSYIMVFNYNRRKIKTINFKGFKGSDNFIPNAIAIDSKKKIYLAGYTRPGVVVLDENGSFLTMIIPEDAFGKKKPKPVIIRDLTLDKEDKIYLLSEEMGSVYVYNQKFDFLFKFGKKGGVAGTLSRPRGIAVDQKGRVYITDYMRHCVNIYDTDGTYLSEFGGKGIGHGWFNYPQDMAISQNNILAVADLFNKRAELFQIIN